MVKRRCNRRQYLQWTALLGSASLAGYAGHGQDGDDGWVYDQDQNPEDTVTALNRGDMGGDPATAWQFEQFKEQTGLTMEPVIINPDNALEATRTRLQAQDQDLDLLEPLAVELWSLAPEGYFEEVGHAIDDEVMDGWLSSAKEAATLPQPFMDDFPTREGVYGAPTYDEIWVNFVNMDILEEAGYDRQIELEDMDHLIEIASDVQSQGITDTPVLFPYATPGEGGNIFMDQVVRNGGQFFDGSEPVFNSEGVRRGADAFLSLFREGVAPKGLTSMREGTATQQFFGGEAVFMFNASSNIFLPGKELPIDKPAGEVARPLPYPQHPDTSGETPSLNATPTFYALSVFSTNKENAAKFLNYSGSYEAQKAMLIEEGNMGLRGDIFEDEEVQEQVPHVSVFQSLLTNSDILKYPQPGQVTQMVYDQTAAAIANDWGTDRLVQQMQSQAGSIVRG